MCSGGPDGGRPLLFLDVDRPLIPCGLWSGKYATYPDPRDDGSNPTLARINPGHGPRLAALPCVLVWATTWGQDANELIAQRLGLPSLEAMTWPCSSEADDVATAAWRRPNQRRARRANRAALEDPRLIMRAAGRAFAWVDDEITDIDREWVRAYHPGSSLLHHVDPRHGLTEADYAVLSRWLRRPGGMPES